MDGQTDTQIGRKADNYNYHIKKPHTKSQQQQKLMGNEKKHETYQSQKEVLEDQGSFNRGRMSAIESGVSRCGLGNEALSLRLY